MDFQFEVSVKIQKPIEEVFDAVYDNRKLEKYFTTGSASAPLDAGTIVTWDFADFPGAFPVSVKRSEINKLIELEWASGDEDYNTTVVIEFSALQDGSTQVRFKEGTWRSSEKGLERSYQNCQGWTQMGCCLKAWLEYGINLRKGFF
jgi:uncharacterized protein YndB with AHSA1/START domain